MFRFLFVLVEVLMLELNFFQFCQGVGKIKVECVLMMYLGFQGFLDWGKDL